MSIRFKCPKCNTILSAPDTSAGKKGQCSKCKTAMRIPTPSKPSKPAAPAKKETVKPAAEKPAVPPEKNITEQQVFARPQKQKSLSRNLGIVLGVAGVLAVAGAVIMFKPWDRVENQRTNTAARRANTQQGTVSRARNRALFLIKQDYKWGYIDSIGNIVIQPQYDVAGDFHEGLARVKTPETGKYGYINTQGEMVIQAVFERCGHFYDGMASIEENKKIGFIDKTGKIVIPPQFDRAHFFQEGLCHVITNGKDVFIDKTGSIVLDPPAHIPVFGAVFQDGLVMVTVDGKIGYMDKTGSMVIPAQYRHGYPFREGLASVQDAKFNFKYIDNTGKIIIETNANYTAYPFADGLARFITDNPQGIGFMDRQGKVAFTIPFGQYDVIEWFSNGLAQVNKDNKWGYIDKKGDLVIPIKFSFALAFSNGLARVDDYCYIDKSGRYVWPKGKN